jgi:phage tail-like protein
MPVFGTPRTFAKKFKFIVEIDGLGYAGFQDCSELSAELATVEQWEGGGLIALAKDPGRLTFPDITLTQGATQDLELFDWFKECADAAANGGLIDPFYRRTADIVQLDRDNAELMRWRVQSCWVKKFIAGSWDNNADENVVRSITLVQDFFDIG